MAGKTFGFWTVIERTDINPKRIYFLCKCACGTEKPVRLEGLLNGRSKSCGCDEYKQRSVIHGQSYNKLYGVWKQMRYRCYQPNNPYYKWYGARGIKVCDRWRKSVAAFIEDMGPRPPGGTIERINNDGNYEPGNCRWATQQEQCCNTRQTILIEHEGKTQPMKHWARELGISYAVVQRRVRNGQTHKQALRLEDEHTGLLPKRANTKRRSNRRTSTARKSVEVS